MRPDRSRTGAARDGSIQTILGAGSSGIAAITWAGEGRTMPARSGDGRRWPATSPSSDGIAHPVTLTVDAGSGRRSCIGPTTVGGCSPRLLAWLGYPLGDRA